MSAIKNSTIPLLPTDIEHKGFEKVASSDSTGFKHQFWNSWKLLALGAALCFATSNLMIGENAHLGFHSIFYFNSGGLIVCIAYFLIRKLKGNSINPFSVEGHFDIHRVFYYGAGAFFGLLLYGAITVTFYFCIRAGLNIGIAATIWGFSAILSSIMEYNLFGTELQKYHIFGLLHMLLAVAFISMSAGAHSAKNEESNTAINA